MQKGNFNLYDVVVTQKPIMSIYEQYMSTEKPINVLKPNTNTKKSSVKIGAVGIVNDYETEMNKQYQKPLTTRPDNGVKKTSGGSNFELGYGTSQYGTTNSINHCAKKNNTYIVPQAVKNEQRATHFKMGFEESKKYRPKTANNASNYSQWQSIKAKEQLNMHRVGAPVDGSTILSYAKIEPNKVHEMVAKNRSSNIQFASNQRVAPGTIRATSHQNAYRWVQPNRA